MEVVIYKSTLPINLVRLEDRHTPTILRYFKTSSHCIFAHVPVLYIVALWPPSNTSYIFLTWYQSNRFCSSSLLVAAAISPRSPLPVPGLAVAFSGSRSICLCLLRSPSFPRGSPCTRRSPCRSPALLSARPSSSLALQVHAPDDRQALLGQPPTLGPRLDRADRNHRESGRPAGLRPRQVRISGNRAAAAGSGSQLSSARLCPRRRPASRSVSNSDLS
jgi:hypothetical protein